MRFHPEQTEVQVFTCPRCDSSDVSHWCKVWVTRQVRGIDEHGTLLLDGYYKEGDDNDAGDDEFYCAGCDHTWPMGDWPLPVDWI